MVRRPTMGGPEPLVARLAVARRATAVVSLHLPEGEQPNQPTSLAETAADSGSAQKLARISRSPHWTPLASSGMYSFRYRPLLSRISACGVLKSLTETQTRTRAVAEDRLSYVSLYVDGGPDNNAAGRDHLLTHCVSNGPRFILCGPAPDTCTMGTSARRLEADFDMAPTVLPTRRSYSCYGS